MKTKSHPNTVFFLGKKRIVLCVTAVFLALFLVYAFCQNNLLVSSHYEIKSEKIPDAFDGFLIAQISDFHNTHSEILQNSILEELQSIKPDIIVITGDFIDSRKTDRPLAVEYSKLLLEIAPVYMSAGNHEAAAVEEYPVLKRELSDIGVKILRNTCEILTRENDKINIMGIDDPLFIYPGEDKYEKVSEAINSVRYDKNNFTVALAHRPEVFSVYREKELDLVLSGHAHGGQFRIPFMGGLFTPTEGFFPKYTEGVHKENSTTMVISRGIGNSIFPIRIHNRPELVFITLMTE